MSSDMSNLMNQINSMIQNNQIPEDIQNIIQNLGSGSKDNSDTEVQSEDISQDSSSSSTNSAPEIDIETMMKMTKMINSMKSQKNDPRANLLLSLKPYLKESRKSKVDQYIQLFNMGKVFEMLGPSFMGGENKK